eukprot:TRINITY_DN1925_c0_g1_i1.p3 TRINITY_DN1925_c0_g1~~TRINITY_DN1925_c0_g1_i1.p3  ORF type:complete len:118 (+),score=41.75 TRINITY_DN1925_c0_g1_i1:180-533(+)
MTDEWGATALKTLRAQLLGLAEGTTVLLEGFPNTMRQALHFELQVMPCRFVLHFDGPEDLMRRRADGAEAAVAQRISDFGRRGIPVIAYFKALKKLAVVSATEPLENIWQEVTSMFN